MKTFVCQVCGHVAFDQAPVDCPVCNSAIENFENDPDAIKKPADPDNLNELEKKHLPIMQIDKTCGLNHDDGCLTLRVSIGETEHVMESEHFINFMDVYVNRKYISRVVYTPKRMRSAATLHLNVDRGTLSVIANCNVHGNWRAKMKLEDETDAATQAAT